MAFSGGWSRQAWRWMTTLVFVFGTMVSGWGGRSASAQETTPELMGAVPEAAVLVHWTDLDREGAQWQQSEELLARVGLPDALEMWQQAVLDDGERRGGITRAELDDLLGGEMAIVVMPVAVERAAAEAMENVESDTVFRDTGATPAAGGEAVAQGVFVLLRPSDIEGAWQYAQRQIGDAATEMGVEVEEGVVDGAETLVLPAGAPNSGAATDEGVATDSADSVMGYGMGGHEGFAAARAGDFIVGAPTEADLRAVIEVVNGNGGALAESPEFQTVAAELATDALSFTYVNGAEILGALDPEMIAMAQSAMMDMPVEALASQWGLAIAADEPGFRFETVTILNDAVDLSSFTVENDPAVADAAERVPADAFAFQAGRLPENAFMGAAFNVAELVNAAGAGAAPAGDDMGMMFPTEEEMAASIAAASATLGFDLEADLFDLLGDEFIAFSSFPSMTFDDFGVDAAAAVSTSDADALSETMTRIAAWIDRSESEVDVSARQIDGSRVFVASEGTEGLPGLEFGVLGDQAVVGLGGGIDALATEPAASLADDGQFQTVMGLLPAAYYQIGYVDVGQAVDPLLNLIEFIGAWSGDGAAGAMPTEGEGSPRNIRALGAVAFHEGNVSGSSAILYIER